MISDDIRNKKHRKGFEKMNKRIKKAESLTAVHTSDFKEKGITLIALVVTIVVLLILAGISINLLLGENGLINKSKYAKDKYSSSQIKEILEMAISEAKMDSYDNSGREVNYENLIGYAGILQEKVPDIDMWINSDILLYGSYYFQVTENLDMVQVDYNIKATYKSVDEMKDDYTNLHENDIVLTRAYYEDGNKRGGAVYKITSDIGDLAIDDGRVIKIDNSNLFSVLQMSNNSLNVMQYGVLGNGKDDDTTRLQKIFDMIYKNGGGTVYFPEGTYIVKIQEDNGYSSSRACLTILGGNINLIGAINSEIKQVGMNNGDLSEDYLYDSSVEKYYRGHTLMFGSEEEPINENILIRRIDSKWWSKHNAKLLR